ncbi:lactonase family protein [Tessaracoccus sp. OS52]|uniref:lactonase family protein n=1 Tax=Tessaracoccus sp. OS52 TaxID=2886691 RepID=UPI001D105A32|nr:beta-propeller fold lactonase family protein [Tessaracoccus sp. OS52]MCC2592761.1 lactonase family protein [Tessaracoccus sp. OS52]
MSYLVLVANAGDGSISTLRQDGETLERLTDSPVGNGCNAFAFDADRNLVHVATEDAVVTLSLDRETGRLSEVSRRHDAGAMVYLALAHGGTVLAGASYHEGYATAWPVIDGVLGDAPSRHELANAHCVVAEGDVAYVASLGQDVVAQFRLGPEATLTPLDPPSVAAPDGSGPRHLVLSEHGAYLVTEFSAEAIRFDVAADATLSRAEAVRFDDPDANLAHSRYGADPRAEHLRWGADVHVAGNWLLCSERTASTIASVRIGRDGRLGEVGAITKVPEQPRGFGVSPDQALVVAVGERSPDAVLYRVSEDGSLVELDRTTVGAKARWARFV